MKYKEEVEISLAMLVEESLEAIEHEVALPRWIRASKAAEILGVPPSRITRMIQRGQLTSRPHPTDPRGVLVDRDEVEAILEELRDIDEDNKDE